MPFTASGQAEGGVTAAVDGIVVAPAIVSSAARERTNFAADGTSVFLPSALLGYTPRRRRLLVRCFRSGA
jgi:hypothetical protein